MFAFVRKAALGATVLCLLGAGAVSASVVSITGLSSTPTGVTGVIGIPPGGVVGNNNINTNTLYAFNEQQGVTLGAPLTFDRIVGTSIPTGTRIDSHYVVFDPRRNTSVTATITFSSAILGLITSQGRLLSTNLLLGAAGVTYNNSSAIGLERIDGISFSDDFTTLTWRASNPGDHMRVITAAVPLPAAGLLLIGALGGLAALRRRKMAV